MTVYGKRVIEYIIQKHSDIVKELLIAKKLDKKELNKLKKFKINFIDNKTAQKITRNGNHQGYIAKIEFEPKVWDITGKKIVILDNVTDMGNIGAIIRTSYALGIDLLIITGIKDLKWSHIIRTSAGAALDMKILSYKNILELVNILKTKGYVITGADMGGECKIKAEKIALILGNEGEGIRKKVKEKLDKTLSIEMKNGFDSLNVSVAAGILIDRITNEC
ncbi:23S rRNA (guanosine(2251)-2'-O)-methyltransferase RlmB [Nautilia sp.]